MCRSWRWWVPNLGWPLMAGDVAPQQVSVAQTLYTALAGGDADRVRDLLDTGVRRPDRTRTASARRHLSRSRRHDRQLLVAAGPYLPARAEPESFDLCRTTDCRCAAPIAESVARPTRTERGVHSHPDVAESGKITRLRQLTDTAIWCDAFDGGEVTTFPGTDADDHRTSR